MNYRRFGRLNWNVSEIGHGTWAMGRGPSGWQDGTDEEATAALQASSALGCTFYDTAWIYGRGHSETLLGRALPPDSTVKIATKIPPLNMQWPSRRGTMIADVFPYDHIVTYAERSLHNLGRQRIDLLQFHVWEDDWANDSEWKRAVADLKARGLIEGIGISVNTWEPTNVLGTLETGLIDAVQVIYNVFEQQPEDALFPYCERNDIAVIARVPFDEGSLTGSITLDTCFDADDWRASYFVPENLAQCVPRVERLQQDLQGAMSLPEFALRFVLDNPAVTTVIPGMRRPHHVQRNIAVSDDIGLSPELRAIAHKHRWDRTPTTWSQ